MSNTSENIITNPGPFKLGPWLKHVIWGGERIASFKGIAPAPATQIGESWELSAIEGKESVVASGPDTGLTLTQMIERYGELLVGSRLAQKEPKDFPVLIKFIDARQNLSLQVHPDDDMAAREHNCTGKTEMWYVVDSDPDAVIYAGFTRDISSDEYETLVSSGGIMDCVAAHESSPGEVYFLPAGRIHAIGAGNFLVEIQRSSDVTYRVYDYNRTDSEGNKRPLHVDAARRALDFTMTPTSEIVTKPQRVSDGLAELISCEYFKVKRLTVEGTYDADVEHIDSFLTLTCIAGRLTIKADNYKPLRIKQGDTAMIPAHVRRLRLAGNAIVISVRV